MPNEKDTIPGTDIPRDIDPLPEAQGLTDEEWAEINRKILARAKEIETAFIDAGKASGVKPDKEAVAIEAAAYATAAGHIGGLVGMPPDSLKELVEVAYQEIVVALLKRMMGG